MKQKNKNNLFNYLIFLTFIFIMLEISFFIHANDLYLGDFKLIANHLHVPLRVLPGIIFYLSVQLLVHFLYVICILGVTNGIVMFMPRWYKQIEILGMGLWLWGVVTILFANQYYFPNSKFAYLIADLLPFSIAKYFYWVFFSISLGILTFALLGFLLRRMKLAISLLGIIALAVLIFTFYPTPVITDAGTETKPNIIIIGVDSLRPDFLGFFGGVKRTPHLDALLENATVFSESLTPIARTFPAWMSILTGEYPKKDNIRFDLQTNFDFDLHQTLPSILQRYGYETIFSTDETRFSNIDQTFGFDHIITPPTGFNDFLVGTLNDFPMSNLLVNTFVGSYLFPYSYANRAVFTTYNPNSFIALLKHHLTRQRQKPVLLITHFCLSHTPYFWGERHAYNLSIHNYQAAILRVDQQVNDYLNLLQQDKLLEHSIVIILSDHGEAIELRGDRATDPDFFVSRLADKKIPIFYPPALDHERVNQSAGHGTDILSMTQYHTVLAFRFYGLGGQVPSVIPGRVSLLDIKPTILHFLGIESAVSLDGQSLLDYINGKKMVVSSTKDFFTETDFSPQSVRTVHPEARKVLFEGINFFEINPRTARLSVKKDMANWIISSKQYADFNGPWVLAVYPQKNNQMVPILVNLDTGFWTNDLSVPFAKHSPAGHMLHAMENFYGNNMTSVAMFAGAK